MADVAIFRFDRLPSGNRLPIGNRKIFYNVETRVPLTFFDNASIGPLDLEKTVTLDPHGSRSGRVRWNGVIEFVSKNAASNRLSFSGVLDDLGLIIRRGPRQNEA